MVTTEITTESWASRIGNSIKSFLFGIVLFIGSFPLLFLNEGRAVKTEKSLKEGQGAVVTVPADRVDPANEHKLVHLTGKALTSEKLSDPEFVVAADALKLRRRVEMYQWEEKKESKTEKKVGGGSETTTTYSYAKTWSDRPIDSSNFKEASAHQNPSAMPFESRDQVAEHVTVGAFNLTPSLVGQMNDFTALPVKDEDAAKLPAELKSRLRVHNGSFYQGADPANPEIGDTRVTFTFVAPGDVSVISKQAGSSFEPYRASAGMDIEMLRRGVLTAKSMFETALTENTVLTWVLRIVGFFVMFFGLLMFFKPISVLGDVIPFVGNMMAFGTGLFSLAIAAALSIGTIAVAWIFYRPVLGVALLAVAIAALVWLAMSGKKKAASVAAARLATSS